jgi:16S rRNA (uracil1498-N3)-methyltransferase|tara:strand:+ start:890 stop:1627 length:738 start_codon:yes stop_codon:yes gene_type:complete
MRIPRIFTAQALAGVSSLTLEAGPSQHLAKVLRLAAGAPVCLFDGSGNDFPATILTADKRAVTVALEQGQPGLAESPLRIHLGIGVSRGERMDWVVQKATELGVAAITPLYTERTEVRLRGERETRKLQHWQQIAISACEQSGRSHLPQVFSPETLPSWLGNCTDDQRLVLHHRAVPLPTAATPPASLSLLVGPEGGLSAAEIEAAEGAGFKPLALGPRVLRTETAPLAALAILQARWGDMPLRD